MMMEWAELAAPIMFSLAARLYTSTRLADRMPAPFNLIISNVPGPPIPLYFCGARLVDLYPLGPILDGLGLNLTVLSNMDHMGFGFIACRELMPDLWDLAHAVPEALAELGKATDEAVNGALAPATHHEEAAKAAKHAVPGNSGQARRLGPSEVLTKTLGCVTRLFAVERGVHPAYDGGNRVEQRRQEVLGADDAGRMAAMALEDLRAGDGSGHRALPAGRHP